MPVSWSWCAGELLHWELEGAEPDGDQRCSQAHLDGATEMVGSRPASSGSKCQLREVGTGDTLDDRGLSDKLKQAQ